MWEGINTVIGHFTNKSWIQIYERNQTWLLFEYAWNGFRAEFRDTSRNQNHKRDSFNICFDYDSFSNKSMVNEYVSWTIKKMERSDLAMQMGFKENEILRWCTSIVSPFMPNMKQYTALCVYTDINMNQSVGYVRAPLLSVVPVKSRYGEKTYVTYEQLQFFPLSRSNIQTI